VKSNRTKCTSATAFRCYTAPPVDNLNIEKCRTLDNKFAFGELLVSFGWLRYWIRISKSHHHPHISEISIIQHTSHM